MNMTRGRGSHRGISLGAVAVLGLALAGCGGGGSAATPAAQSTAPAQAASSAPPAAQSGSSTGSSSQTGSTSSGSTGTGSTTSSTPPTANAGTVTINWVAPTQNVDGSPLTNLAGYNIHYGTTSGNLTQTIQVSNPGLATYVVSNLTPGTYYFAVAAVNSQGTESPMSTVVSTTVN